MPPAFETESLSHDPIHGYIPFVARNGIPDDEISEQELIDHPWVQRLRQIHQLQTAPWVFPSAEHCRFQHVLGVMHLAGRAMREWYPSLAESTSNVPSLPYCESLVRLAGLLHDVGHGPFSHFFDDQHLQQFGITHEDLGGAIIERELGELLRKVRRTPTGVLAPLEQIEPRQIAWLIRRPGPSDDVESQPDWLRKLRAMFCGIYTVDNMDFVLRDAYTSGYNQQAFDLPRLLHYSFFSSEGLTVHSRGLPALINFIETRAHLFRAIYFHRTVRAIDLGMRSIFAPTMQRLFPGNPLDDLSEYQLLTEASFLTDVARWTRSSDQTERDLGIAWQKLFHRDLTWTMACEYTINFHSGASERTTILSEPDLIERRLRERLPTELRDWPMRFDVARHYHRPSRNRSSARQNWLHDPLTDSTRLLDDDKTFQSLPTSFTILRIYVQDHSADRELNKALEAVLDDAGDARTNM